jgi:hypothetical protein
MKLGNSVLTTEMRGRNTERRELKYDDYDNYGFR